MIEVTVKHKSGDTEVFSSPNESIMIGKAPGNDIVIVADGVSRYHARLSIAGKKVSIEDLDSTNGLYVNAKKVSKVDVSPSDKVALGTTVLKVAVKKTVSKSSAKQPIPSVSAESVEKEPTKKLKTKPEPESPKATKVKEAACAEGDEFYWQSLKSFLAPIWHYIVDESVTEIMINGPEQIFVERGGSLAPVSETFTEDQLNAAVLNIAQYVGRRVSPEEPYLDARLPDGSRVAVLMEPCSRKGTSIAIRKFAKERLTIEKLIGFGSMTPELATFIEAAVLLKKNIIVSGGTSSGKTSLLNVISGLIPENERIITIEDSAELQLPQDHVLPMETKPADKKGRGEVTIRDLVKASLRMRPDRIIVGEIRGGEAIDLLQAMNTGHSGSTTTLHASSPRQALSRLETLSLFSGLEIPMLALREQVSSAIDIVIQAARLTDHSRKVTHVSEIGRLQEDGTYEVNDIFKFVREGRGADGKILGGHKMTGNKPSFLEEMELSGLSDAVKLFQ
jgi:pilus assembly protein CpaF